MQEMEELLANGVHMAIFGKKNHFLSLRIDHDQIYVIMTNIVHEKMFV